MEPINFQGINKAAVYVRNINAGYLEKVNDSDFLFRYDEAYLKDSYQLSISASLPKKASDFRSKKLHPFFDNLIAEGWLLQCTEKLFHIDRKNRFALLMATGSETIGAVSIKPLSSNGIEIDLQYYFKGMPQKDLKLFAAKPVLIPGSCPYCMKKVKTTEKFHKS